ncbi:hypothetical protein G9A89_020968 [Geosiphon pyriformis]|nr:hypothetical protein G9A89_020968 [Geosiphon pyriformis]
MAKKILLKILSDQISLVYSAHGVLCGDNFLVLKGISTHSLVFAVGFVIKNALEKNRELWLVLQNIKKAYDLRLGILEVAGDMVAFFLDVGVGVSAHVSGILFSIMTKIHAIALALKKKVLKMVWLKIKEHSSVFGNDCANELTGAAAYLSVSLPVGISKRYLVADGLVISGNAHYFVRDIYRAIANVF